MKKLLPTFPLLALFLILFTGGCLSDIHLFSKGTEPLKEYTLSGYGFSKTLLIPVNGEIGMTDTSLLARRTPGLIPEVVAQLEKAERDSRIDSVILLLNSPGGTVTGSDLLYEEIRRFKQNSGKKLYAMILDMAASGGYYIALPADEIWAHPTSLTGSVGVIFLRPQIDGLMKIIGVKVNASTSGKYKDMGSPFRGGKPEENAIFQAIVDRMADCFYSRVTRHRGGKMTSGDIALVKTARIFTADEALKTGLIDRIGYLNDLLKKAKSNPHAKVIVYRREEFHNDNPYNLKTSSASAETPSLFGKSLFGKAAGLQAGFYYLWPAVLP